MVREGWGCSSAEGVASATPWLLSIITEAFTREWTAKKSLQQDGATDQIRRLFMEALPFQRRTPPPFIEIGCLGDSGEAKGAHTGTRPGPADIGG